MQETNDLISVLMPVYNSERYLPKAIESVLNQTIKNFEFIIINDGSTDSSGKIIKHYQFLDKRIIYIERQKAGIAHSLNEGLKSSKGIFLARQDADDISLSNRFQRQISFLNQNQSFGLVGSRYRYIDEQGKDLQLFDYSYPEKYRDIIRAMPKYNPIFHGSVMFRKGIIDHVGYYNEKMLFGEDHEYWIRIAKKFELYNLQEALVLRRYHLASFTNINYRNQTKFRIRNMIFAINSLKLNPLLYIFDFIKVSLHLVIPRKILYYYCCLKNFFKAQ